MRDYAGILPVTLDNDLLTAGWDGSVEPYPGIVPRQFAMQQLRKSLLKKFEGVQTAAADLAALGKFLAVNENCRNYRSPFESANLVEEVALGEAKRWLYNFFNPEGLNLLGFWGIVERFNVGNGASIGSYGTDFLSKFGTSTMAATSDELHALFRVAVSKNRVWSVVESNRSKHRGYETVQSSRLTFVPKTAEISRTICVEPLLNMVFQQGIAGLITERLVRSCGIDLSSQPDKNRVLARIGSQNGKFGTIDLSSASDSISLGFVREFLPPDVTIWLEKTRCGSTVLPNGERVELHMVSSMGNAFTFPLQTAIFTALVYGAYAVSGLNFTHPRGQSLGSFAVFGDDIIVNERAYRLVCRLLMLCGFSVNVDKSFNDGLFRESCGRDFYSGYPVRGVYIKSLKDEHDVYSAINRLNKWSAEHAVPLSRTVSTLLRGYRCNMIPPDEAETAGVMVPRDCLRKVRVDRNGSLIYYTKTPPIKSYNVSDVDASPPSIRGWVHNPEAVLLAAIAGTLRDGLVTPRLWRRPKARLMRRVTPRWDYIAHDPLKLRGFGERWKTFARLNLSIY